MSDEGVSVCGSVRGRFDLLGQVSWGEADFTPTLAGLLKREGGGRNVLILYDMVEQYYRKEMIPSRVAFFDRKGILNRKLSAVFPNYGLRSALPLKISTKAKGFEQRDRTQAGLEGKPYLFAALPESDGIRRVTDSIRDSLVNSSGVFLLPVESVGLVNQLSTRLNALSRPDPSRWIVFLSQHSGGGLRQIVVRNGELALTRLTPVIDSDLEPQVWASEVAQEYNSTMGYLSRFGYTPDDDLEVIALGSHQSIQALEGVLKVPRFFGLSVAQAAKKLGLSIRADETVRHADLLHAAWLSRKISYALPLSSNELDFLARARMAGSLIGSLLIISFLATSGYAVYQLWTLIQAISTLDDKKTELARLDSEYQKELQRKESYGIDVKLVLGSVKIADGLEKGKVDLIDFLQQVAKGMEPSLRFDDIDMAYVEEQVPNPDQMSAEVKKEKYFRTVLTMSFDEGTLPELANKTVSDLKDRIAQHLPTYDVGVSQAAQDLTYGSSFQFETGISPDVQGGAASAQRLVAQITIKQKKNDQHSGT